MVEVPQHLSDLGLTAVALFLFVAAIYLILKIVQTVKHFKEPNGNGKKHYVPCIQTPQLSTIMSNQGLTLEAIRETKMSTQALQQNMVLQTKLMDHFGHILEKLSDIAVRSEARK